MREWVPRAPPAGVEVGLTNERKQNLAEGSSGEVFHLLFQSGEEDTISLCLLRLACSPGGDWVPIQLACESKRQLHLSSSVTENTQSSAIVSRAGRLISLLFTGNRVKNVLGIMNEEA